MIARISIIALIRRAAIDRGRSPGAAIMAIVAILAIMAMAPTIVAMMAILPILAMS
jgi:hypothetical protein